MSEIYAVLEARAENAELERRARYETATMVAMFVGHTLSGSKIPDFEEVYQTDTETKKENEWLIMKERLIDFAEGRNKR